jgi:hypothetical protein
MAKRQRDDDKMAMRERETLSSPQRLLNENGDEEYARQVQKAGEDADRQAAIAWQHAANEAQEVEDEYQGRMED